VVRALEELPHDFKMVVLLVDLNDFSYAQVADILGIPVGTVMSRLHRGRRMLRTTLHDFAVEEGYVREEAVGGGAGDPEELEADRESPTRLDRFRERKLTSRR
jgi:RNA polymerase sigma-70 factor (ECF subfamily)